MPNKKRKKHLQKKCPNCLSYVQAGSRRCSFCGHKFKSVGKYLVDKLKDVLRIERAFTLASKNDFKLKDAGKIEGFFTQSEIEMLLKLNNINIPMFIILDNINLIDETALMELGEMLININKNHALIKEDFLGGQKLSE